MEFSSGGVEEQSVVFDELSSDLDGLVSWFSGVVGEEIDGGTASKTAIVGFLFDSISDGSVCESVFECLSDGF